MTTLKEIDQAHYEQSVKSGLQMLNDASKQTMVKALKHATAKSNTIRTKVELRLLELDRRNR